MKSRILTAVIGLPVLAVVLFFYNSYFFNIAIAVISVIAVYEMLHATRYVSNPALLIISMLFAATVPFSKSPGFEKYFTFAVMAFVTLLMAVLFIKHKTLKFKEIAFSFTAALLIPYALSSLAFIRGLEPKIALYFVLLVFMCAWISDAGAYFVGLFFGKHKLAPTISPKKTIEGALGGIGFCVLLNVVFTYIYADIMGKNETQIEVHLLVLVLISLTGSVVGILGDLSTSIIKRQCGIKDFGNLMPGHGGVLDRFDSIMFIAPFLFIVLQLFPVVTILNP